MAMVMGEGIPPDSDPDALRASNFWRFVLGFPIILLGISMIGVLFYVKYEPPKYLVFNDRKEEAKLMIKQIYDKNENSEEIIS